MEIKNKPVVIIIFPLFFIGIAVFIIYNSITLNQDLKEFKKERTMTAEQREWHDAVKSGNRVKILQILKSGTPVDMRIPVIRYNDRGADSGLKKMTGLMVACENGNYETADLLIRNGAEVNLHDMDWMRTPLIYALLSKNKELVKLLVDKKADVNWQERQYRRTARPLVYAVSACRKDLLELLVKAGSNVNAQEANGENALYWSERCKNPDIKRYLQMKGAR